MGVLVSLSLACTGLMTTYALSPGVGTWNSSTAVPDSLEFAASATYNNYVYEIGGQDNSSIVDTVYAAPINSNGTLGSWSATTALPITLGYASTAVYDGYVYEIGGSSNSGFEDTVYAAPINSNGTLGSWSATTALPQDSFYATSAQYNGYVYVIGGDNGSTAVNTIYFAKLSSGGVIGSWSATTALPNNLSLATAVAYNGYLYVLGGVGLTNTVLIVPLSSDGTLGSWSATTPLPDQLAYATSIINNGIVYEFAGADNSGLTNTSYYAPLTGYSLPDITGQILEVKGDSSVSVNVVDNVSGNPDPSTLSIISGPNHGVATDSGGILTYTPASGYLGTDSLVYQICSLSNSAVCSQATLTFDVTAGTPDTGFGTYVPNKTSEIFVSSLLVMGVLVITIGLRRLSKAVER